MTTIRLPTNPADSEFQMLSRQWSSATDAQIVLPRKMSDSERNALIRFLLSKIPDSLALGALCELAERPGVPPDLLIRVFDEGDTGCKIAVCLRDDLTAEIKEKCRSASDPDVREHFLARQTSLSRKDE